MLYKVRTTAKERLYLERFVHIQPISRTEYNQSIDNTLQEHLSNIKHGKIVEQSIERLMNNSEMSLITGCKT